MLYIRNTIKWVDAAQAAPLTNYAESASGESRLLARCNVTANNQTSPLSSVTFAVSPNLVFRFMSSSEKILLFNVSESDHDLVKRLVTSFEIDTVSLTIQSVRSFLQKNPTLKICLAIYKVKEEVKKQERVIALIRDFVGPLTPILLLIPRDQSGSIRKYIAAGADDFIELPLNPNRFSVSFLILLEMGQIIAEQAENGRAADDEAVTLPEETSWNRLVNYFQSGVSYFAPKSLIPRSKSDYIFDRWEQVKRLGIGGFGVVWLVKETATGRLAVAKTPHSPQMNIRVLRSAAILKRLVHHPNIVHLIEIVKESGRLILIQEYVNGPTLQELLQKPITPLAREDYFLQLVSVISYAHKQKILHRDIKPENILINKQGQLKLLDFGIARDLSWQSAGSSSEGTVNFMPPEQFAGKSCLASDVWALGVILYIFTTNNIPYSQQNEQYPMDIETKVQSRSPRTINPDISPKLERIILKCLEVDLDNRYKNGIELQDDLRHHFPEFGRGVVLQDFSNT